MKKVVRTSAVDGVRSVEKFDRGAVGEAQFDIAAVGARVFVGDPFVGGDAVVVAAFLDPLRTYHENDVPRKGAIYVGKKLPGPRPPPPLSPRRPRAGATGRASHPPPRASLI